MGGSPWCVADRVCHALLRADRATVVVTETGARRETRAVRASGPPLTAAPLTVMVNEHTASASEIFAGALRDNCRALLVGTRHAPSSPPPGPSLVFEMKLLAELSTCALCMLEHFATMHRSTAPCFRTGTETGLKECMTALVPAWEHRRDR